MKLNKYFGTLLFAGAILLGCSKATDSLKPQTVQEKPEAEKTEGPNAFILKIEAENAATKALTDLGQTLGSEWKQGDSISVYNVTAKETIEGWLYAEADGTSTTFSGTVAGNFNQGDILLLQFLAPDYMQQDGTLEGLAAQCDYATSHVEVTAIDPEAKTISTEQANFEKMQAVVKFSITNRKNPVEPVKVTSFMGYGKLPGQEIPFGIYVKPVAATDELYVGIPYIENLKITFEAEGEDGFDYRLIVPEVSFEEGLYYRRQLNMKRRISVKAPVAIDTLVYNSVPQKLVEPAHVYWIVNEQEVILDNDKDYQQDSCVISYFVKKEETADTVPTAPTKAENGWMTSIPTQTDAGTYYVWTKMTGNYDYEDADVSANPVKVVIAPKVVSSPTITLQTSTYTYDGNAKTPTVSSVTDGADTIPSSEYTVSYQYNTQVAEDSEVPTVIISDVSGGNYTVSGTQTFTINKAAGWLSLSNTSFSWHYGAHTAIKTVSVNSSHGGEITSALTSGADYFRIVSLYSIKGKTDSLYDDLHGVWTFTCAQTRNYNAATATVTLTIKSFT